MTTSPLTTFIGNLTKDPELRFTPAGVPVASFNIAMNERVYNSQTKEWEDGPTSFVRVEAWRQVGENAAATLTKGMEVIVVGKFKVKEWTTRDGEKRLTPTIEVTGGSGTVGPSLRFATGSLQKSAARGDSGPNAGSSNDPWNAPAPTGSFSGGDKEPPF